MSWADVAPSLAELVSLIPASAIQPARSAAYRRDRAGMPVRSVVLWNVGRLDNRRAAIFMLEGDILIVVGPTSVGASK
jgi:hypothetical protein